jgi:hypothetical protein
LGGFTHIQSKHNYRQRHASSTLMSAILLLI